MGRNKIKIEKITNERTRLATFNKRKNGLVKKAMELAILCGCEVALIVIGNNKLTQYSSSDMDQLLLRYTDGGFEEPHAEPLTSDDYPKLFGKKNKANLVGTCTSTKESPAKKPRVESPTPLQSAPHAMVKPLAPAHHDGRNSPSAAPGATLVPRGPSPPLGVKPVSPPAGAFAPGQGARLAAAPQQQLASPSYPSPYMGGYPATRTSTGGQFPSQSSSPSRSTIPPSLYSVPSTLNSTTPGGRISPPQRGSFGSAGSVSPSFEGGKPQSPRSNPPTPPGSGGHYAEEMRRASAGRLHQEQQFTLKVNKKNLSLAIPDPSSVSSAAANGFPGSSSSAGHSRHNIYSPGFTGLNVPSGVPFMGSESDMAAHSAILPSPSAFFAGEGTPGSHPESAGHYASSSWGGWLSSSSPRHHEPLHQHQQPFLSRDLNLALHDGTLHQQLSFGKQIPYAVGDKRKAQ